MGTGGDEHARVARLSLAIATATAITTAIAIACSYARLLRLGGKLHGCALLS